MSLETNKWCNVNINASPLRIDAVLPELKELAQIKSYKEFREEFSDCLYSLFCMIDTYTGITVPMLGCGITLSKAEERFCRWKEIFKQEGLEFNKIYLKNGNSYNKESKVKFALELARIDQVINIKNEV